MADDPDELRLPFTMTVPWKRTRGGQPWPIDKHGRYWPADRLGRPMRPFHDYNPGEVVPGEGIRGAPKAQRAIVPPVITATADSLSIAPELFAFRLARIGQVAIYVLEVLGGGILVASGTAEAVIAVAAGIAGTKMVLDIWGTRMRFANGSEVANYLAQILRDPAPGEPAQHEKPDMLTSGSEPLIPTPPVVRLPGFTLDDHPAFQIPDLTPAAPVAPLPGFATQAPQPLVPPDAGPVITRPLVVEQAARSGDPTRTRSERARRAARAANPDVTQQLADAEWQAHHLINVAGIERYRDLIEAAARAGWRTDDAGNLVALPTTKEAQRKLQESGLRRPLHDNRHAIWNAEVGRELEAIRRDPRYKDLHDPNTERNIKTKLDIIQNNLRHRLDNSDRITQLEIDTNAG